MSLPLVSIVTPSLNQGSFIRETIESVLSQAYPNLEYWVVDGGSTDETLEILRSYGERLRWVSEPDGGQSQAVNKGWRHAKGEILGWVNADDLLVPGAVRRAVDVLLAQPNLAGVYGDCSYIDAAGKVLRPYPTREFDYGILVRETEDFIPQPAVFLRRGVASRVGFLDETLHYVMDYDLWLRMGMYGAFAYLPQPMACLRLHQNAKTLRAVARFAPEMAFIFECLVRQADFPAPLRAEKGMILRQAYIHAASFAFWAGETVSALSYLRRAWVAAPWPKRRTFYYLFLFSLLGPLGWNLAARLHGNPFDGR